MWDGKKKKPSYWYLPDSSWELILTFLPLFDIIIKYLPYRHTYQNVLKYFSYWWISYLTIYDLKLFSSYKLSTHYIIIKVIEDMQIVLISLT